MELSRTVEASPWFVDIGKMTRTVRRGLAGLLTMTLASAADSARASIRVVPDEVLAASSVAAVHGTVVAIESRWDPAVEAIYTYVTVDVWQSWGYAEVPWRVVLKQLGGRIGDRELQIGGQATFAPGEEVFAFLEVRPRDGTLYVAGFEQGKWTVQDSTAAGMPAVLRETHAASFQSRIEPERRGLAELEQLAERAGRYDGPMFVAIPAEVNRPSVAAPAWAYLTPSAPARWHEAASGQPVYVDSQAGGHPQIQGGGIAQLTRAIAMWRDASSLNAQPGVVRGPRCFGNSENDGRMSISYGDPCGEIADNSTTLAIGGYSYGGGGTQLVGGVTFRKILKGMVVVDNKASKFQNMSRGCYEQMLAHEIGHAVGFGHSAMASAIMYPTIGGCGGRTTSNPLSSDERAGLGVIYPSAAVPAVPSAPQVLTLSVASGALTASWQAPASGQVAEYLVEAGSTSGASNLGVFSTGQQTSISAPVGPGQYFIRVRARGSAGTGPASAEASIAVAAAPPPLAPGGLTSSVSGSTVMLNWTPPAGPTPSAYLVEAGSAPSLANLATITATGTALSVPGVAPGVYYVRVRAIGTNGMSAPSNEVPVVVSAAGLPGAPTGLSAFVSAGRTVTVSWTAPASGTVLVGYQLEAGNAPGLANLAVIPLGPTPSFATAGVPPGLYYLRVRGLGPTGAGHASNDAIVYVP